MYLYHLLRKFHKHSSNNSMSRWRTNSFKFRNIIGLLIFSKSRGISFGFGSILVFNFIILARFHIWFSFMSNCLIMFFQLSLQQKLDKYQKKVLPSIYFSLRILMTSRIFMFPFIGETVLHIANITLNFMKSMLMVWIKKYLIFITSKLLSRPSYVFMWL